MKSFSTGCIAALSIALLVSSTAACGGANFSDSVFAEPGPDASISTTETGEPGEDAQGGPNGNGPKKDSGGPGGEDTSPVDTGTPITAENICSRLAEAICTPTLSNCCTARGHGYKDAGCKAAILKDCSDKKTSVEDGETTLNLEAYGACVAAWSSLSTKCGVPILEFVKAYAPCNQLFNGTTPFGGECTETYQCKVAAGAYANCTREDRCDSVTVGGMGQTCGIVMGNRAYCDVGLYCQYTSASTGTCRTAKAIGAPCSQNYECGFGNYCDRFGVNSCKAGAPAGASCSFPEFCASVSCVSGRCTDPNISVASPEICTGSGGG